MGKFINKFQNFMYGRYGTDKLYHFQFMLLICLFVLDLFVNSWILELLQILTLVIMLYRFFSKDIYKRCRENEKFLELKDSLGKPFINIKRNMQDKKHIYKKCRCGTTLKVKVPKKRGIKHSTCPNCGKRVRLLALKCSK